MLYYETLGKGDPVLLLHGYLENLKMWKDIAVELAKEHLVIMCDNPGHGRSSNYGEVHSMEFMAQKINEVLEHLNVHRVPVVGHSMGGYITLAFVELFPEKVSSFLLLNSSTLSDTEEKKELRKRAGEVAQKNIETLIKMSIPLLFAENASDLKSEKEFAREMMRETSIAGILAALKGMSRRPERTHLLNDFDSKIGILLGKADRTVDPQAFKKSIPKRENISVLELDCGHMSFLEKPDETIDFVKKIID